MKINENEPVWYQRYRPQTVEDCVLPDRIKNTFRTYVEKGELDQSLLLTGYHGIGKTSIGKALINDLGAKVLFINGSEDSGIDVLRTRIRNFSSTTSLSGEQKIVFIDEAEYMNPTSTQPALRGFIEEFAKNTQFILTCNYKNKLIPELADSRFAVIDFSMNEQEKNSCCKYFFKRVCDIFEQEGIVYDKTAVGKVILKYAPDFRKPWNELQRYNTQEGHIDLGILSMEDVDDISTIVNHLKAKKFKEVVAWVENNPKADDPIIITEILDGVESSLSGANKASAILSAGEWQYKAALSVNKRLAVTSFLIEVMSQCTFDTK